MLIDLQEVTCEGEETARYGKLIGVCYSGGVNLNEWMVRNGWALAYRKYSELYIGSEEAANKAKRGIWAGKFTKPFNHAGLS